MEDRAIHEDQAPVHLVDSSEIENSSRPRIRHNVLLRPTDSGLVEVTNQDEAKLLLAQMEASDNHKKESTSKLDPQTANEDPSSEAGSQAHEKSSPALWRAFSEAPKLAKVDCPNFSFRYANRNQVSAEDEHLLISYFGDQVVQAILALYENILNSPLRKAKDYGTVTSAKITDRELRTKIHTAIRRIFNSHLETTTNEDGAVMIFAAAPKSTWTARTPTANQEQKRKPYRKGKPGWTELGGEYLHFTLYKENKDTMEVISFLARQLNLKARSFQFAGTKDRRAVTAQRVSVYRVFADRMTQVGRSLKNAKIGDFEYQPHGLQLGDLTGNEFTITLRDCEFEGIVSADSNSADAMDKASQIVRNAVANLKRKGFINYYGLQRFGTFSTRTDTVGLKILQGDFKAAVEAVLDYSPTALAASQNPMPSSDKVSKDDKARACALRSFQTSGKIHPALDQLPHKFSAETSIIQHLGKPHSSNDFQGALMAISRNLRLMYVHAYQSLVWNIAASERWKQFGDQVLEGDLVLVEDHKDKIENAIELDKIDADGELVVHSTDEDRSGQADDIFTRARALTKDEATSGHYSIFDIVLPTPGFDILYPANEIALVYTNFMASDRGGGLDPLDMRRKWKDFSLSGSYRKLLARPGQDVSYDIKMYKNDDEQFVKTDIDDLFNDQEQPQKDHFSANVVKLNENSTHNGQENEEVGKVDEATKFAVVLKLQLGTSQYATIALRELMKANGLQAYKPDFGGGR